MTVLLLGYFRQALPVIPRETRSAEVDMCVKSSCLFSHVQKINITNMRVHLAGDEDSSTFARQLLCVDNGTVVGGAVGQMFVF